MTLASAADTERRLPTPEGLRELLEWRPEHGILSAYVVIDPADRGEGWRTELRNELAAIERPEDHAARRALEATVERVLARFPDGSPPPAGRTQIGFLELAEKERRDLWFSTRLAAAAPAARHSSRASLEPLVALLDRGPARGVAAVSAERVRLWRWQMGALDEVDDWELSMFSRDWREQKAQRPSDPARVQGVASSGKDRFGQRLEHNRERFLHEAGRLAVERQESDECELLAFGDAEHVREFQAGAGDRLRHGGEQNLISAPVSEIENRVTAAVAQHNRERERELVAAVRGEAAGGMRGALGAQEVMQALGEGRVAHLLYDPAAELEAQLAGYGDVDGLAPRERMIELAISTSAAITPLEGEAAEALADAGGVAGLLRY